jgi:hypothetical protein
MRIENTIIGMLTTKPDGLTLEEIEAGLSLRGVRVGPSVAECLLLLSDQIANQGGRWFRRTTSKSDAVVEALRRYAGETGRRVFKAEAALRRLPAEQQPTREELRQMVLEAGEFELLKNDMIKWKE